jgi:hypothetical protein
MDGDLLAYRALRDCPSCRKATLNDVVLSPGWVRVTCRECTLLRDLPRIRTVVREPFNGEQ